VNGNAPFFRAVSAILNGYAPFFRPFSGCFKPVFTPNWVDNHRCEVGGHAPLYPCMLNRLFFNPLSETMQECMQKIFYFFIGNDTDVGAERA